MLHCRKSPHPAFGHLVTENSGIDTNVPAWMAIQAGAAGSRIVATKA
jgi:hypothetical protein